MIIRVNRQEQAFTMVETVIAIALLVLCVTAIANGYLASAKFAEYATYSQAAQALVIQRMEQVRCVTWDLGANPPVDQVIAANFPTMTVALDTKGTNSISATITTTITTVQATPPVKCIKVVAVWPFYRGKMGTNQIITYRVPAAITTT